MAEAGWQRFRRRVVSVPAVVVALWVVTALFPGLVLIALVIDLFRLVAPHPNPLPAPRGEGATVRLCVFLLCFLVTENLGLLLLFWTFVSTRSGSRARMARTFAIQRLYTALHLRAVTLVFSLKFVIHGSELVRPGPVLVFCRHASLVDVLIPGGFIANVHKLELRYVLKRELLAEPCLDVAGHWIPNHFVDRRGLDTEKELAAVGALKAGIGQNEGVIIYPEGTRFSAARREAGLVKLEGAGLARAERLRHLLPIRPGGALTLLAAAPSCDVLFVGHHGLEGLTRLEDIWRGSLVGRTVTVQFWREPADSIPPENAARLLWVNDRWQRMDDWLETLS